MKSLKRELRQLECEEKKNEMKSKIAKNATRKAVRSLIKWSPKEDTLLLEAARYKQRQCFIHRGRSIKMKNRTKKFD